MAIDVLLREVVEGQLDQIELLRAMYPSEGEIVIEAEAERQLENLRQWCDNAGSTQPVVKHSIPLTLTLDIDEETDKARKISLSIEVPLTGNSDGSGAMPCRVRIRQPDWLTKAQVLQLSANIPQDDIMSAIEHVREEATNMSSMLQSASKEEVKTITGPLVRVWFYFPSISTREKRDDIVNYAPGYGITGFLLAGKPGILCLEGGAQDIDDYMKFIKTESWGDIPSQHKKVSERYRETADIARTFTGMQEITDQIEKGGQRSNRGDMQALEKWLGGKGLGDAFSKVLM